VPDVLKTVGRYEILREVGRGGMAMVYLARQTDLDRFVALKELAAFHASDAAFAQRFLRESRVAGSLSHPNIVTVHDYFEYEGTPYIAMEYVERGSLRPFVGRMSMAQIGGVLEGLLAGLAHAEQHGIVHRDLKPENLMVTSDGRVKIADFGIAKATRQMQTGAFLTATGTTVGTPAYMAPEQAMAQEVGPWTDLYSVGCMAFELFTGHVPFHDSDAPMAILLRHVNEPIPSIRSVDPTIDEGISSWTEQLLVKDPKQRMQSAAEAWDEFEEIIIGLLGPRWRRSARLLVGMPQTQTPEPLTPAPFEGPPDSDEFQSFAWGERVADAPPPGPDTPPPRDAPPGPLAPGPIDVPTGPATPPPIDVPDRPDTPPPLRPEPPAPAEPEPEPADMPPAAESAFLTFGAPPPPPPAAPAEPAPAREEPAEVREEPPEPEADTVAPEPESRDGFETYQAPPPPRPPTGDAPEPPAREPVASPPVPAPEEAPPEPPAAQPTAPRREPEPAIAAAAALDADGPATAMPEALKRRPEPERGPEPERAPRDRSKRAFPIALGIGLVAAIAAGLALGAGGGDSGGGDAPGTPVTPVSAGAVQVKVPDGYQKLASPPAMPGLDLDSAASYAPGGDDTGPAVTFGGAQSDHPSLLPAAFRRAIGSEAPAPTAVKLGPDELQAFRYEDLRPAGSSRQLTVYAAPTSEGIATVACSAPPAQAAAYKAECEAIADTLEVSSGKPFPVGPDPAYAKTVAGVFGALNRQVTQGANALARQKTTFRAQADAARGIARAYSTAATKLGDTATRPVDAPLNAALAERLTAASDAWKSTAAAADAKQKRRFDRSEARIKRTRAQIAQALSALETAGYRVGGGS
jgi:serine/threonine protein kinase